MHSDFRNVFICQGLLCQSHRRTGNFRPGGAVACARLSDSIRSGNVLKAKLRRARLGKGGGGGGKNAALSLSSPRAFFAFLITERLSTTISEPGTG